MNYPILGGPLDGGNRPREALFPWAKTMLSSCFLYQGEHWYEFDPVREEWVYRGMYEVPEDTDP